jgi:glypican 2 (cerebroglycan)
MEGVGRGGAPHDGGGHQPAPARAWQGRAGEWAGTAEVDAGPSSSSVRPLSLAQVLELRERLGRVRGFWAGLPLTVCEDTRMAADISQEAAPCWTGLGRGR